MLKGLVIIFVTGVMSIFVGGTTFAVWMVSGGVAVVSVDTPDTDLWIPVPTRFADLGLGAVSLVEATDGGLTDVDMMAWREELNRELSSELGDIDVGEFTHDLLNQVASMPNGALVEVHDQDNDVWIGKRRGRFIVRVDSPDAKVRVSIPARSAKRVGHRALALAGL